MPVITPSRTRFTAEEFERMADAGLFGDRRIELINGRLYRLPPTNDFHMTGTSASHEAVQRVALPGDWALNQGTLRVDHDTTVDPDVLWLPVPKGTPWKRWPTPILVIEVAVTTYKKDSGIKLRKYAKIGISDYWIVNVKARRVEVYRKPIDPTGRLADCGYEDVKHYTAGQSIPVLLRPGVSIAVEDCLPKVLGE